MTTPRASVSGSSTRCGTGSARSRASNEPRDPANRSSAPAVEAAMRTFVLLVALAAAALLPAATRADNAQLVGTVGPGYTISLVDAAGKSVESLEPGTYDLVVH